MANSLYVPSGAPVQNSPGSSSRMRDEFALIEAAFDGLVQVMYVFDVLPDANSATATDQERFLIAPFAGTIGLVQAMNHAGNATTDTILGLEINGTPVVFSGGDPTIGSAQAAETVSSGTATSANIIAVDDVIKTTSDNAGTSVMPVTIQLVITRTS